MVWLIGIIVVGIIFFIGYNYSKKTEQKNDEKYLEGEKRLKTSESSQKDFKDYDSDYKEENIVNLAKLNRFANTPRALNGEYGEIIGHTSWEDKEEWRKIMENCPLIYAYVVQADLALYEEGDGSYLQAVLIFADDKRYYRDAEWLKKTSTKLKSYKYESNAPPELADLVKDLRKEHASFCVELPSCLVGDAKAWCTVYKFEKQSNLPKKYIPDDGILPFFLKSAEDAWASGLIPILPKYYS